MVDNLTRKMLEFDVAYHKDVSEELGDTLPKAAKYLSVKHFVLTHGQEFRAVRWPKGIRRRKMGQCFANALELAMTKEDLVYVEGFACMTDAGCFLIHHAWCVNNHHEVIDPTWKQPEESHYFGVPFRLGFLCEHTRKSRFLESILTPGELGRVLGCLNPRLLQQETDFKQALE